MYLRRHLIKSRSTKLRSFISRLQELNAYLEGQEPAPLPADEIVDIIYHSMPTIWKNKIMEQGKKFCRQESHQNLQEKKMVRLQLQ